jgi:hypothetical protein
MFITGEMRDDRGSGTVTGDGDSRGNAVEAIRTVADDMDDLLRLRVKRFFFHKKQNSIIRD